MQHVEINSGSILEYIQYCWLIMYQISNMIQNDAIMLESVVEYCNRVNSQLLVIKFNAAC